MRAHVVHTFGEGDSADAGPPGSPRLNFDYDFAAKFLRRRDGFIDAGSSATTRDPKSIRSENGFTLTLVKTRHDEMCRAILAIFGARSVCYLTANGLVMAQPTLPHEARPHPREQEPASLDGQRLHKIRSL